MAVAQGRRVALVIGNGPYRAVERLTNPANDARRANGGGLAEMHAPEGTLISYTTRPGNVGVSPASFDLQGSIQPDRMALLSGRGTTGAADYKVRNTASGQPFAYTAVARFSDRVGQGRRTMVRPCRLDFAKQ